MELDKKKYKRDEVFTILNAYKSDYEIKLKEQRDRITELLAENRELSAEIDELKKKDALVSSAIIASEEKAVEIERNAKERYNLLTESLRSFIKKWKNYFEYIAEKYPFYGATKEAKIVFDKISEAVSDTDDFNVVEELDGVIPNKNIKKGFNPQEKIDDYIAATGDNGFNLDEVLNPGKLELGDICKELGLIEEL